MLETEPITLVGVLNVGLVRNNIQSSKTITPTTEELTVRPDEGYDGMSRVIVNAVTNDIDSNIVASNIKEGVEILGVAGTYEQGFFPSYEANTLVFADGDREISVNESELILE